MTHTCGQRAGLMDSLSSQDQRLSTFNFICSSYIQALAFYSICWCLHTGNQNMHLFLSASGGSFFLPFSTHHGKQWLTTGSRQKVTSQSVVSFTHFTKSSHDKACNVPSMKKGLTKAWQSGWTWRYFTKRLSFKAVFLACFFFSFSFSIFLMI